MPDRQTFTAEFKSSAQAGFPILTDVDNGYAFTLNLAIWVGAEMERMMAAAGIDVSAAQGNDAWMLPIPATFIVGRDGVIPRMGIEDMLAALRRAP